MPEWYVSQADVEKHPKFGKAKLEEILWDFGLDVKKGYMDDGRWKMEDQESTEDEPFYGYYHKALCGEYVKCPRYIGFARNDGPWRRFINRFLELPVEFTKRGGQL